MSKNYIILNKFYIIIGYYNIIYIIYLIGSLGMEPGGSSRMDGSGFTLPIY